MFQQSWPPANLSHNAKDNKALQRHICLFRERSRTMTSQGRSKNSDQPGPLHSMLPNADRACLLFRTDTVKTHLDVGGQEGVKPQIAGSAWTSEIQYLGPLIAVAVVVFIGLILAFTWMYWQTKKARQTSGRGRRPGIDSIQPKYEVKNEYVVVPDFK